MRKSDVFDSFVKIALDRGLISNDKPLKEYLDYMEGEPAPKPSREEISTIEALYGVSTKPIDSSLEYENNIIEVAHPYPVVVAPSYDRLNGLVENENERHNILMNILNRTPTGVVTNHKYAEHDLLMALVKVGNELDNADKDDLRKLSDVCLEKVSSTKITKRAIAPLVGAVVIASLFGALWLQQHLPNVDEGFEANYQRLNGEIDDLINSSAEWGVGVTYTPEFKKLLIDLKAKLTTIYSAYQGIKPVIMELDKPTNGTEAVEIANSPKGQEVVQAYNNFDKLVNSAIQYLVGVEIKFKDAGYKSRQVQQKGVLNRLLDKTQILHGGNGLFSDNIDDVRNALSPFIKSVYSLEALLKQAGSYKDNVQHNLEQVAARQNELMNSETPKADPAAKAVSEEDAHAGTLDGIFTGKTAPGVT